MNAMTNNAPCEDCHGTTFELDISRAERICSDCGLVDNHYTLDADTNSSSSLGDTRHSEALDVFSNNPNSAKGGRMNPFGDRTDYAGNRLSPSKRQMFIRLGRADRSSQREQDPMCRELKQTLSSMFGENLGRATTHLADATCRKLSPEREAIRKTLSTGEQTALICPKTSITRKPKGIRGKSHQHNLQIMALAVATLSHKWLRTPAFNPVPIMERYEISKKQFRNAMQTISKSYKARCRMGWAAIPDVMERSALRADKLDIAAENLVIALAPHFDENEMKSIQHIFWGLMTDLMEPSIDGPMANLSVGFLSGCVMHSSLNLLGLEKHHLGRIASAVGLSPAGLSNRLKDLENKFKKGHFPEAHFMFASNPLGTYSES
jgi:hypothetical protein